MHRDLKPANVLVVLVLGLVAAGCGPANRADAITFPAQPTRVYEFDLYSADSFSSSAKSEHFAAAGTVRNEWFANTRIVLPFGINPIGALPPLPRITVVVYPNGKMDSPPWRLQPEPWGWADKQSMTIHVEAGDCNELPGLFHGLAHVWGDAPFLPHDPNWVLLDLTGGPVLSFTGQQVTWPWVDQWDGVISQWLRNARAANGRCP